MEQNIITLQLPENTVLQMIQALDTVGGTRRICNYLEESVMDQRRERQMVIAQKKDAGLGEDSKTEEALEDKVSLPEAENKENEKSDK